MWFLVVPLCALCIQDLSRLFGDVLLLLGALFAGLFVSDFFPYCTVVSLFLFLKATQEANHHGY